MITSKNIVDFVRELGKYRRKLIAAIICPLVFCLIFYFVSGDIIIYLSQPLGGENLFFISPVEGIMVKIKLSLYGGFVVATPVMAYLIIKIFAGVLKKCIRKRLIFFFIPVSTLFLAGGMIFGYKLVLPGTISFLLNCGRDYMQPLITGSSYISFIAFFLILMGLIFEFPLIIYTLYRIGVLHAKVLMKKRKYVILAILVIVAFITPTPDAFTLLVVSVPVYLLYEISIWLILALEVINKKKNEEEFSELSTIGDRR